MNSNESFLPKIPNFNDLEADILFNQTVTQKTSAPVWILVCYYIYIAFGVCFNSVVAFALLRSRRNGLLSSVLQLTIVDLLSTYVGVVEIWAINNHSWVFSTKLCSFYLGSEVLCNTYILYHLICINFHIISSVNLFMEQIQKECNQNPLTSYHSDDESESVTHQKLNRTVVIDYRPKKSDVSIIFPSLLVWFICLSLSVPQYTFANAIVINSDCTLCTILDTRYRQLLQDLLLSFRIIIPLPLLIVSVLVLIKNLYLNKYSRSVSETITEKAYKIHWLLNFGISLTILYIITSFQRQFLYFLHMVAQEVGDNNINSFKMLPLENIVCSYLSNLLSAMLHYSSSTLRALLYIIMLPELQNIFKFKTTFLCCIEQK